MQTSDFLSVAYSKILEDKPNRIYLMCIPDIRRLLLYKCLYLHKRLRKIRNLSTILLNGYKGVQCLSTRRSRVCRSLSGRAV
jgi:hypothetical protein